jgi:tetratricopeptide (TPR) repeat protein
MRALAFLVTAIALAQDTPHIKSALAQMETGNRALRSERFEEAIQCFQNAIRIEPTFLEAHELLIGSELKSNKTLEAGAAITRFLEIVPGNLPRRLQLAQILLDQNQPERALAQYSFALRQNSKSAEALLGFAKAAAQAGMPDRASEALQRGHALYPSDKRFSIGSKMP